MINTIHNQKLQQDVDEYVDLTNKISDLQARRKAIRSNFPPGRLVGTDKDVVVSRVKYRRILIGSLKSLLTPAQIDYCTSKSWGTSCRVALKPKPRKGKSK